MSYWEHVGKPGEAEQALQEVLGRDEEPGQRLRQGVGTTRAQGSQGSSRRKPRTQ